jgi:hypothetical protein
MLRRGAPLKSNIGLAPYFVTSRWEGPEEGPDTKRCLRLTRMASPPGQGLVRPLQRRLTLSARVLTAIDNGQHSPRKLLAAVVRRLVLVLSGRSPPPPFRNRSRFASARSTSSKRRNIQT